MATLHCAQVSATYSYGPLTDSVSALPNTRSARILPMTIVLDKTDGYNGTLELDIVPPAQSASLPTPSKEAVAENDRRKALEDSIRKSYTDTFCSPYRARELAASLGLDPDKVAKVLVDSRGNHETIIEFLKSTPEADRQRALSLLLTIWEKTVATSRPKCSATISPRLLSTPLSTQSISSTRV